MNARSTFFFLLLTVNLCALAADKAPKVEIAWADHLVPVDPYWNIPYRSQLRAKLKIEDFRGDWMLIKPSFDVESLLRLEGSMDKSGRAGIHPDDMPEQAYTLTYIVPDKSVYYSMPENNEEKKQGEVTVSSTTVEMPKALGLRVRRLWSEMLLGTHYGGGGNGLDGTTYEFHKGGMYGTTWSPRQGSPLLFVELGEKLMEYCKVAPAKRAEVEKELETSVQKLEKYLKAHPSKLDK